jgi:hypothetical protein
MSIRSSRRLAWPLLVLSGVGVATPLNSQVAHAQNSAPATATSVPIQGVNGAVITIGAGRNQGIVEGQTLPVFRGGSVVALVKITAVEDNSATGTLLFSQDGTTLGTSDFVSVAPSSSSATPLGGTPNDTRTPEGTRTPDAGAEKGVVVPFESGASNESVPKAERTYELLASLAAQGLIRSQPARFFQDDGARRHRYAEDIVLSRAQIVGFIEEALGNMASSDAKPPAALVILTRDFRRDLPDVGIPPNVLGDYTGRTAFGVSGFLRARLSGGDTGAGTLQPFDERYGAGRVQSGADVRLNGFGSLSRDLNFYASVDSGSRLASGLGTQTQIRKAFLSYNAEKLLRGLTVDVGRKEFYWGVGTFGTGVVSDAPGGLDSLSTRFERGSYRFDTLYANLGRGTNGQGRSLYGHNLSVRLGQQARVGLSETILQPTTGFSARDFIGALTPVSLYLIDRPSLPTADNGTNAVLSAYAETGVARGVRTYGEIVVDDLAINGKNRIENRDGATLGVQLFNPRNPARAGLSAEYTRTNGLFYLQFGGLTRRPDYEYFYRGAPIGFPIVPSFPASSGGAESLRFEAYYQPLKHLTLFGSVQFADINSEDQMAAATGARGFSRQQVLRLAASYDLTRNFSIVARAQRVATDQPNFIKLEPSVSNRLFSLELAHSF